MFLTLALLLGVTLAVAITFWEGIVTWADQVFFPWLDQYLPTLAPKVRSAFAWFDKNVAVPIRNAIKEAWKKLRQFLLKAVVKFERESSNRWVKRWTAYLIKKLETKEVVKQEVTEAVDWSTLPDDVRAEFLRRGISEQEINVTKNRDDELNIH